MVHCSVAKRSCRGECSKVPIRVSEMPTPLKTYSKFQIHIFCVFARNDISGHLVQLRIELSWLFDFFIFDYFGVSTRLWICPIFSLTLWTTNVRFWTLTLCPLLVVFMILSNLKKSIELNKMTSVEKASKFTRRPWAFWMHRKHRDYKMPMGVLNV